MSNKKNNKGTSEKYYCLKIWYRRIKQNLTMILLVPTLIGGAWQIFSLLGLGFEYVRFFSVTQLVADGLLMMILIPLILIIPTLLYFLINTSRGEYNKLTKSKTIVLFSICLATVLLLNYYYLKFMLSHFSVEPNNEILLLALILYAPSIQIVADLGFKIADYIEIYLNNSSKKKNLKILPKVAYFITNKSYRALSMIYYLTMVFAVMSTIMALFVVLNSLGDSFVSDNLVNLDNVDKVLYEKYGEESEDYSIKYFNDSYIFIEKESVSTEEREILVQAGKSIPTKILILEFDTLFETK